MSLARKRPAHVCNVRPGFKAFETRAALRIHERKPTHLQHAQHAHSQYASVVRDAHENVIDLQDQEPSHVDPSDQDPQPNGVASSAATDERDVHEQDVAARYQAINFRNQRPPTLKVLRTALLRAVPH